MARDDLLSPTGDASGGIDSKCSSLSESRSDGGVDSLLTHTRAGPTYDPLPPFCWDGTQVMDLTPHKGHPDCFEYDWADVNPAQSQQLKV